MTDYHQGGYAPPQNGYQQNYDQQSYNQQPYQQTSPPPQTPPPQGSYYNQPPQQSYDQQQQQQNGVYQGYQQPDLPPDHVNIYAPQPDYVPQSHPPITLYYGYQQPIYNSSQPYTQQQDNTPLMEEEQPIEKPPCRDPCCAGFFLLSMLGLVVLSIWAFSLKLGTVAPEHNWQLRNDTIGIFAISCGMSAVLSIALLCFIQANAACMVWTALLFNAIVWMATGALMVALGLYFGFINIAFGLLFLLYPWCLRHRIAFVATMIKHSISALQKYKGVFIVAIFTALATLAICAFSIIAMTRFATYYNSDAGITKDQENTGIILLVVMMTLLYWACEFLRGFLHTVIAGVVGTWWYLPSQSFATGPSVKRAATTSMGSIAFGTLLVTLCNLGKTLARIRFDQLAKGNKGNAGALIVLLIIIACIALIFSCFERCLKWINHYAFTFVALYGTSYMESGSRVMELFFNSGFAMIIQKDMTNFVISIGVILATAASAGLTLLGFWAFKWADFKTYETGFLIGTIVWTCFLSAYISTVLLTPLSSATTTTFVTWSEDAAAMEQSHGAAFKEMVDARNKVYY